MISRAPLALALISLTLAGCGGHASGSGRSSSTTAPSTSATTPNLPPGPSATQVTDVHGALERVPGVARGAALAFLPDGASAPLEITDAAALEQAGALPGRTLVVSGAVETNTGGATALLETITLSSFTLDERAFTARVQASGALQSLDGAQAYQPLGPLAAALQALPVGTPARVTGRIDATFAGAAPGLIVTSFQETAALELRVAGGLTGLDDRFMVVDLAGTGAYRATYTLYIQPDMNRQGDGFLAPAARADLAARAAAADLHNQPKSFTPPPGMLILDVPTTSLRWIDRDGEATITIQAGATLPRAIQELLDALRAVRGAVSSFRELDSGGFSRISQAGVRVAADDAAWQTLWNDHTGGAPGTVAPTVDFTRQRVVAVFMGRQPTGGYAIAVERLDRVGDELHLTVARTTPAPGSINTQVITSPYQFVIVELAGATDLYVDGARQ